MHMHMYMYITGLLTNQTGRHRGRRAEQHRCGVQTRRIRPIAFDIVKDVGVSGVVQPCLPGHTLMWCAREDHGCDRPETLMSDPTA